MNYRDSMIQAMTYLGEQPNTVFLGQSVLFRGTAMYSTLNGVPDSKKIEMPVAEEMQLGISIGMAIPGYLPVSIYPRMDFLILAMSQLVNHLDKIEALSEGRLNPKVIIRTSVGGTKNLNPGLQHLGNYIEPLKLMLTNIDVVSLDNADKILPEYQKALEGNKSTILCEFGDLYDT